MRWLSEVIYVLIKLSENVHEIDFIYARKYG